MAKLTVKGLDEYALAISKLNKNKEEVQRKSIYRGAGVIADEIKQSIRKLPIEKNRRGTQKNPLRGISRKQKSDLINSMGISPFANIYKDLNVKIGFDGYGSVKTKKYSRGLPNQLLARSIESGASFREKHPFVRPAVNRKRKEAQRVMGEVIDKEIEKEMK